jgi:hypothetical protein
VFPRTESGNDFAASKFFGNIVVLILPGFCAGGLTHFQSHAQSRRRGGKIASVF